MNNIFLIGFMGAGKSSIARSLKKQYQMELIEMDEKIEAEEGMSISELFQTKGEAYFRSLETQLLENLIDCSDVVVSCGGGVPMRENNVSIMRQSGKVIYLSATPETIYQRVHKTNTRPLLAGNMNVEYISGLMEQRLPKYLEAADLTIHTDGKSIDEVCREILQGIKNNE